MKDVSTQSGAEFFNNIIIKRQAELDKIIDTTTEHEESINWFYSWAKALEKANEDYVHVFMSGNNPSIHIFVKNVTSFKNDLVINILSKMEEQKDLYNAKVGNYEYPETVERTFKYEFGFLDVAVHIRISNDSDLCYKIKVDSKLVEVPTYELICA